MTERGQIVAVKENTAFVRFTRTSACGKCHACGMLSGQKDVVIEVENTHGGQVGDLCDIALPSQSILKASLLAYLFPLCFLVAGLPIGSWLHGLLSVPWHHDLFTALFALGCTLLSFGILKACEPVLKGMQAFKPRMVCLYGQKDLKGENTHEHHSK